MMLILRKIRSGENFSARNCIHLPDAAADALNVVDRGSAGDKRGRELGP